MFFLHPETIWDYSVFNIQYSIFRYDILYMIYSDRTEFIVTLSNTIVETISFNSFTLNTFFFFQVNRGDVEMVRVQPDMMSAQYITKDGARREVNLIPNAQIEDQLFNQLADKKVT